MLYRLKFGVSAALQCLAQGGISLQHSHRRQRQPLHRLVAEEPAVTGAVLADLGAACQCPAF